MAQGSATLPVPLVGDDLAVPCVDGRERPYVSFDAAASTGALPSVLERVQDLLPSYSSIHRGAGYKSQIATAAYESARRSALTFARRRGDDVAIICRNTTEALNHLAYRLRLESSDVVLTTVAEHHANLLPWRRMATCRYVECGREGIFGLDDVVAGLDRFPRPRLVAITGASNITGWLPPLDRIIGAAHERGVQVVVDAAQLAPHRPLPEDADFIAWSGHKMYAPFGAGILVGPRSVFADGDPFLVGGGAVDLVGLDEVVWTEPPEREEAGSPNVLGAAALEAAMSGLEALGWTAVADHDAHLARRLDEGLRSIPGVEVLGPPAGVQRLPVLTFQVEGTPHALVAARLAAEEAIGVRHGCFCAHPYLVRLLGLSDAEIARYREEVRRGDRRRMPGAVRASAGLNTKEADVDRLLEALGRMAAGDPPPVGYHQDPATGDFWPEQELVGWPVGPPAHTAPCSPG